MVKNWKLSTIAMAAVMSSGIAAHAEDAVPTVKLMVGGIDKQIYLPYQLAEGLGYYKKYGVNVELSTETEGGVGAEAAVASGEVEMAGAWYNHTIDFQLHGKKIIGIVQLSGAPGERVMCAKDSKINTPADWKGKAVGVTDIGSGTDDLTLFMAARDKLTTKDFHRVSVGAGATLVAALQHGKIVCGMTTQPTVNAIEKKGIGYSAFDLASTDGATRWLGGTWPTASVLARADWVEKNKATTQKVVNALVATMHYIATHSAADIADHLPANFTSNPLSSKQEYIDALDKDKGQFLPDGMMPKGGPETVLAVEKAAGKINGNVDLPSTYTDDFVIEANKTQGFAK
ncbi:ABC transporter substrate-binding protein [Rhizobium sp. BK376]|uniref:ABC transporter substrate-binding protein n=1 Tax=Rhizobium sp. BK376 TaxID=2512149 RepID=UPI001046966F|nr:ABC transporter substrate-binding protein [Rhizobium sp. BK376]TCR85289.1 NitT/TauT family transport system substrate-binding protein [Rhizobium sp. BK376]